MTWNANELIEVTLNQPDDFLKVRETLTRIGVAARNGNKLYQSCHIFHKQGKYYIVHFKEMFLIDGKESNLSENDIQRRNTIAKLMRDWGLVNILDESKIENQAPISQIKILHHKDKGDWELIPKYNLGNSRGSVSATYKNPEVD